LLLVNTVLKSRYDRDDYTDDNSQVFREISSETKWIFVPRSKPNPNATWEDWFWAIEGIALFGCGFLLVLFGSLIARDSIGGACCICLLGLVCATGGIGFIIQHAGVL
jgi:hypothetical protein